MVCCARRAVTLLLLLLLLLLSSPHNSEGEPAGLEGSPEAETLTATSYEAGPLVPTFAPDLSTTSPLSTVWASSPPYDEPSLLRPDSNDIPWLVARFSFRSRLHLACNPWLAVVMKSDNDAVKFEVEKGPSVAGLAVYKWSSKRFVRVGGPVTWVGYDPDRGLLTFDFANVSTSFQLRFKAVTPQALSVLSRLHCFSHVAPFRHNLPSSSMYDRAKIGAAIARTVTYLADGATRDPEVSVVCQPPNLRLSELRWSAEKGGDGDSNVPGEEAFWLHHDPEAHMAFELISKNNTAKAEWLRALSRKSMLLSADHSVKMIPGSFVHQMFWLNSSASSLPHDKDGDGDDDTILGTTWIIVGIAGVMALLAAIVGVLVYKGYLPLTASSADVQGSGSRDVEFQPQHAPQNQYQHSPACGGRCGNTCNGCDQNPISTLPCVERRPSARDRGLANTLHTPVQHQQTFSGAVVQGPSDRSLDYGYPEWSEGHSEASHYHHTPPALRQARALRAGEGAETPPLHLVPGPEYDGPYDGTDVTETTEATPAPHHHGQEDYEKYCRIAMWQAQARRHADDAAPDERMEQFNSISGGTTALTYGGDYNQ